jgi:hypothetical protein
MEEFKRLNQITFRRISSSSDLGSLLSDARDSSGMGGVFVLWFGGREVMAGRITLGDFVAFNAYLECFPGNDCTGLGHQHYREGFRIHGRINQISIPNPRFKIIRFVFSQGF